MGYLYYYADEFWPICVAVAIILIFIRYLWLLGTIIKSLVQKENGWQPIFRTLSLILFPYHKAATKNPVYTLTRGIFHICLFAAPLWYSRHLELWEESMFAWTWKLLSLLPNLYLSDTWIEYMTVIVISLCAFFILRRCVNGKLRTKSSKFDFIFIFISGMPFVSGYILLNNITTPFRFIDDNLNMLHILSGEVFLLSAIFLVLSVRLDGSYCTGCAACSLNCPTGALCAKDTENERRITYCNYQCMCCGTCVAVCPEEAVELRHAISIKKILTVRKMHTLQRSMLRTCDRCNSYYVTENQFMEIKKISDEAYIRICQRCKQVAEAEKHYHLNYESKA